MKRFALLCTATVTLLAGMMAEAHADPIGLVKPNPQVETGKGALTVAYVSGTSEDGHRAAALSSPIPLPYHWRLLTPCEIDDATLGGCEPGEAACPATPDRVVTLYEVLRQRVVQPDRSAVDDLVPDVSAAVGEGYGGWLNEGRACVDVTDLNPPPSPDEVFRYFQTLPLPQLTTRQQPPGEALVGLPVIFFTDSPTTQTFTVDIRGFTVTITARATSFTWTTGDGATLTTTDPSAPYPDQTITHDYAAGTYTAGLTTTWGGTFTVDGGAAADVPGTTTTQGAPATFAVRQARAVLTDPYD